MRIQIKIGQYHISNRNKEDNESHISSDSVDKIHGGTTKSPQCSGCIDGKSYNRWQTQEQRTFLSGRCDLEAYCNCLEVGKGKMVGKDDVIFFVMRDE